MSNVFFGIDLGTSQCSVAYVVDNPRISQQQLIEPKVVEIRQQEASAAKPSDRFPSIIGADFADKRRPRLLFGWDFLALFDRRRRKPLDPVRRGRDFFQSVKSDMGTNRVYPFSRLPDGRTPVEVTARLLEELVRLVSQNKPDLDPRKGRAIITVPASFSALARKDTLDAAVGAGFTRDRVSLLDEPVAALLDTVNHQDASTFLSDKFQNVLMFDYGGGTCDLALMGVRLRADSAFGLHIETLAISPYRKLGGDDVDRAIMNDIIWPAICSPEQKAQLSTATVESVSDTLIVSVARRLKEQICNDVRTLVRERGSWPDVKSLNKVRADVRFGAQFSIPGLNLQRQYTMTADEFENVVMRPFIDVPDDFDDENDCPQSLVRPIWETAARADVSVGELDLVILNGVSSLNPFVRRILEEQLSDPEKPSSKLRFAEVPSLTCSVARGAALACYWQHARGKQLVAPIMPEPLGVIVQNGPPEQIVAAGTELPFPGPDALHHISGRFFVPIGCGPEMLVPYYTGYVGSPPAPRHAGTVKVKVPADTPSGSEVSIRLRIDSDKTLHWWFSIANSVSEAAESVEDPWTQRVPTFAERALIEYRRELRQLFDSGQKPSRAKLLGEANLMRRAGDPEGAIVAVNDLIDQYGTDAQHLNVRGLAHDDLGQAEQASADYKAAADLKPDDPILRGNYGCALEEAGHLEEATAAIRLALGMDPNLAYLYQRLAEIARRQGREEEARRELQQAERLYKTAAEREPLNPEAWRNLAFVRSKLGDYEGTAKASELATDAFRFVSLGGNASDVVSGTQETVRDEALGRKKTNGLPPNSPEVLPTPPSSANGRGLGKVAGMHALKELLLREVVGPVRNPEPYRRYGLSIPNGMLLYGPPGCGKTYIARQLAEELGYYFVEIIPSEVASPYIHGSVVRIRELFDKAAAQAPAIIFIDEFEALAPSRSELGGFQDYKSAEVNEFLAHLNGCSEKNIFVIAATNQPDKIDPAVRRTGRLDKHIYVGPPDLEARKEMLALHLEGRPVAAQLEIGSLAAELQGYSASDIRFLVDEAARAALRNRQDITQDSFHKAMVGIPPSVTPAVEAEYRSVEQRGS
jgi:molecular chaperone DnaK (HSP70)/tetratricopeptide (TPR) repeat protein